MHTLMAIEGILEVVLTRTHKALTGQEQVQMQLQGA